LYSHEGNGENRGEEEEEEEADVSMTASVTGHNPPLRSETYIVPLEDIFNPFGMQSFHIFVVLDC